MGWLFAVALGLHRQSRGAVLRALVPIALGHALALGAAAAGLAAAGLVLPAEVVRLAAGALLFGWGTYRMLRGDRHRVRVGMQAGFWGLALWSFLMAGAHGAGAMAMPALLPLCAPGAVALPLAGVAVHTLAMLVTTGLVAVAVYEWVGVGFLRRGWVNLDPLWTASLFAAGAVLIAGSSHV